MTKDLISRFRVSSERIHVKYAAATVLGVVGMGCTTCLLIFAPQLDPLAVGIIGLAATLISVGLPLGIQVQV